MKCFLYLIKCTKLVPNIYLFIYLFIVKQNLNAERIDPSSNDMKNKQNVHRNDPHANAAKFQTDRSELHVSRPPPARSTAAAAPSSIQCAAGIKMTMTQKARSLRLPLFSAGLSPHKSQPPFPSLSSLTAAHSPLTPTSQRSHTVTTLSPPFSRPLLAALLPSLSSAAFISLRRHSQSQSSLSISISLSLHCTLLTVTAIDSRSQQKRTGAERRGRRIVLRENKRIHLLSPLQIYAGGGWCVRAAPRRRCYAASWSSERARPPDRAMGAAPVLVLLLVAAAALPRRASAATDAGDGNASS